MKMIYSVPSTPNRRNSLFLLLAVGMFVLDFAQWHDVLFGHDFRAWQILFLMIFSLLLLKQHFIVHKKHVFILSILVVHTIAIWLAGATIAAFSFVQFALIGVGLFTCYGLVRRIGPIGLIDLYLQSATIISVSIIAEQAIYVVYSPALDWWYQIVPRYDELGFMVRAHGLLQEPSQASLIVSPALFPALMFRRGKLVALYLVALLLTLSTLSFLGAAFAIGVYVLSRPKQTLIRAIPIIAALGLAALTPPVQDRISAIAGISDVMDYSDSRTIHDGLGGTVGALFINSAIAAGALIDTNGAGVGLGQFGAAFDRYLNLTDVSSDDARQSDYLFHNIDTGGNLIIRMTAELGLLGIVLAITLLYSVFIGTMKAIKLYRESTRFGYVHGQVYAVAHMLCAVTIMVYLCRKDGYFNIYLMIPLAGLWLLKIRRHYFADRQTSLPLLYRTS